MQAEQFADNLFRASQQTVAFAGRFVFNNLPDSYRYFVHLNQSFDEELRPDEVTYPDDLDKHGARIGPLDASDVITLLWRNDCVPEWIDVIPESADSHHTFIKLECCGRFTCRDELLYYADANMKPFGCKSPTLPPHWSEGDDRFDLQWHSRRSNS